MRSWLIHAHACLQKSDYYNVITQWPALEHATGRFHIFLREAISKSSDEFVFDWGNLMAYVFTSECDQLIWSNFHSLKFSVRRIKEKSENQS